jgi:hypothetical protein
VILGFKKQFVPFVEEGSKTHTIRAIGKRRPFRPGDMCHCFENARQKTMRCIGRFKCVRVEDICISRQTDGRWPLVVRIGENVLNPEETELLFYRDGFRSKSYRLSTTYPVRDPLTNKPNPIQEAAEFWKDREFPFHGSLIHWEFKPGTANAKPSARKRRAGGKNA